MGKVRIKTFGNEEQEQEEQKKRKVEREQKKLAKAAEAGVEEKESSSAEASEGQVSKQTTEEEKTIKKPQKNKEAKTKEKVRSKSYQTSSKLIEKDKKYTVLEALSLIEKLKRAKFDETVELHINATRTGVLGTTTLPHGTGKQIRVAIADDDLIAQIEKGKIDFDILLASPDMMPKLAKVARVLGPKGLMPNPKNGTVSQNPKEAAKKFEGGQLTIKTEAKFPIAHIAVGKVSFGDKKLQENIEEVLVTVKPQNIQSAIIKSTMSPAIRLNIS